MRNLASFNIGSVIKKLNRIHVQINSKHNRPFPKLRIFWLSEYTYQRRYIKIHHDGRVGGGLSLFVSSLIDFSFIRSIVAHKYSLLGFAYDPVSLFLLELFRYLEKYPDMKTFLHVARDPVKGKHYRLYAGISDHRIPCEATFTNFKDRLGENLYNHISHTLVQITELLGFLSYKIMATDGTLFPTNARYKGCTYFCKECEFIEFKGIIDNVRQRIIYRLADPARIVIGKEIHIRADCPSPRFPPDVQRPKVEVLTLSSGTGNRDARKKVSNSLDQLKLILPDDSLSPFNRVPYSRRTDPQSLRQGPERYPRLFHSPITEKALCLHFVLLTSL